MPQEPELPAELEALLSTNAEARSAFLALSPSHRREYVNWITEAKKPETRERRAARSIVMLDAG